MMFLGLFGCSKTVPNTSEDYVAQKLHWASEQISADLALLTGSMERQDLPLAGDRELSLSMDLVHDGALELALTKVAARAGYQFVIEGPEPQTPVMVHIAMRGRSCLEILREIGRQTGKEETVTVFEKDRRITLGYGGENKSSL